jgi:hypothetical protein
MFRLFVTLFGILFLFTASPLQAQDTAGRRDSVATELGMDRFTAGRSVAVTEPVAGDLLAAGGSVTCDGSVGGDGVVAGGNINVSCGISENLYAAGGTVIFSGTVSRNARLAGGTVEVARGARVGHGLTIAAGEARVSGSVGSYLQMAGGSGVIDGPVGGDVEASMGQLELGPNAVIMGRLRYRSPNALIQDPAAQVLGGVEYIRTSAQPGIGWGLLGSLFLFLFVWLLGLMLLAAILVLALPRFLGGVVQTLGSRPGLSALLGFGMLVCIPVASVILLITMIGAPLALVVMASYFVLLAVGYVTTGAALGDWLWKRLRGASSMGAGPRVTATIAGILVLALLGAIPVLGGLVSFAALLLGLGAVGLGTYQALRPTSQPPPVAPA